jgi:hypothetical protein
MFRDGVYALRCASMLRASPGRSSMYAQRRDVVAGLLAEKDCSQNSSTDEEYR